MLNYFLFLRLIGCTLLLAVSGILRTQAWRGGKLCTGRGHRAAARSLPRYPANLHQRHLQCCRGWCCSPLATRPRAGRRSSLTVGHGPCGRLSSITILLLASGAAHLPMTMGRLLGCSSACRIVGPYRHCRSDWGGSGQDRQRVYLR
jgi:hypothetical protein